MAKISAKLKKKIWIALPAYNEENSISRVIRNLRKEKYVNLVVIDDGSEDRTADIAKKAGAIVLVHAINRGQGAALQTAISYALDCGAELIVTFDTDGQHQIKDFEKMIPLVTSGRYDAVLGSRFLKGAGPIPLSRRILLKGAVIVQRIIYKINLTDAHNGLRLLSRKAAQKIKITSDRMEHSSQIAEQIVKQKLRYKEVPVDIIYTKQSLEKGHGSLIQAFKVLFSFCLRKVLR